MPWWSALCLETVLVVQWAQLEKGPTVASCFKNIVFSFSFLKHVATTIFCPSSSNIMESTLGPMHQRLPIGRTMGGFLGLWSLRKKHEPPNERITQKLHVRWGTFKKWPFKGRYTVCVYIYTADIFHIHPYSNHRFEGQSFSATAKSHGQIIERSATHKT